MCFYLLFLCLFLFFEAGNPDRFMSLLDRRREHIKQQDEELREDDLASAELMDKNMGPTVLRCDIIGVPVIQGPVVRSMVRANHWLNSIKMNRLSWHLTLVSANQASNNSAQIIPFLTHSLRSRISCCGRKTALAEIYVDGNGRVSTNSGSDVRRWDQLLTT